MTTKIKNLFHNDLIYIIYYHLLFFFLRNNNYSINEKDSNIRFWIGF
jgi:hypothetical protein